MGSHGQGGRLGITLPQGVYNSEVMANRILLFRGIITLELANILVEEVRELAIAVDFKGQPGSAGPGRDQIVELFVESHHAHRPRLIPRRGRKHLQERFFKRLHVGPWDARRGVTSTTAPRFGRNSTKPMEAISRKASRIGKLLTSN
jgi:hypothetical protein